MGALNAAARGLMRQAAQPAELGACGGRGPGLFAQRGIQRIADVVDEQRVVVLQHAGGSPQGFRRFFFAQMADHHRAQLLPGLRQSLPGAGGLENHARLAPERCGQRLGAAFLQHNELLRVLQRLACLATRVNVAVKISAGQHHGQALRAVSRSTRRCPRTGRSGRAPRVQRQHHAVGVRRCGVRPLTHDAHRVLRRQHLLPAPCGLPIAVVGIGQRRTDDDDAGARGGWRHPQECSRGTAPGPKQGFALSGLMATDYFSSHPGAFHVLPVAPCCP